MTKASQSLLLTIFSLCLYVTASPSQIRSPKPIAVSSAEAAKWRADLNHLAEELPRRHKNPYHTMARDQFVTAVRKLHARIPKLARHQIIVEMARIVAMIGDGHTCINIGLFDSLGYDRLGRDYFELDPKIGFRQYPLKLYFFRDGLFVQAAAPQYRNIVGGRVISIGKTPVEEVFKEVRNIVFHDNEMTIRHRAPIFMVMPEVLHAFGFIDNMEKAKFVVENHGTEISVEVSPLEQSSRVEWVDMRDEAQAPVPLWLKNPNNNYWFEYLPDSRTLYLQYNAVRQKQDESLADFFNRVFTFLAANPVDRFIIDLRLNGGGNTALNWPLIYGLIRSDKINQRGKLFTIIGRQTFSAAMNCAIYLEKHTRTIFVGEPTGSRPNQYGDTMPIVLPNSGITVKASFIYWQEAGPRDNRQWIGPEKGAELTSEEYRRNKDAAMEAILSYDPDQKSLGDILIAKYSATGIEGAIETYRKFKAEPVNIYADTEGEVTRFGNHLMTEKRFADAVRVFQLNVEAYPLSIRAPVYLGLAAQQAGDRQLAIKSFKKAIELNPVNQFAIDKLAEIQSK